MLLDDGFTKGHFKFVPASLNFRHLESRHWVQVYNVVRDLKDLVPCVVQSTAHNRDYSSCLVGAVGRGKGEPYQDLALRSTTFHSGGLRDKMEPLLHSFFISK